MIALHLQHKQTECLVDEEVHGSSVDILQRSLTEGDGYAKKLEPEHGVCPHSYLSYSGGKINKRTILLGIQ